MEESTFRDTPGINDSARAAADGLDGQSKQNSPESGWEEMISQSEFLGGLMQASSQPVAVGFSDGRLGLVNKAFEELTGYTAEELSKISWETTLTPPEWREYERRKLEEQLITKEPIRYEKEYIRKDGTRVPIELLLHLVADSDGKPKFYYTFLTDITERKQAQENVRKSDARWNTAIDNLREGVVIATATGSVIYWNPAALAMHGFTQLGEGVRPLENFTEIFELYETDTGRLLPLEEWPMRRVIRGEKVRDVELRICRLDQGWERFISYSGAMLETMKGENLIFISIIDLTERKRAEMALTESAKRKDEFLAMLSHELRNPLSAIRHAVELTKESLGDQETCRWTSEVIDRQSYQLSRMVDDLLDVARITRGRVELKTDLVDLNVILRRAIAAAQPLFAQKNHQFSNEIAGKMPLIGDAIRLEQVFVNLLNNAAKYTPPNGRIHLHGFADEETLSIVITDNGIGISEELLPQIFDLFSQGQLSLDRSEGGLGIGLTVVKSLVEMHGGTVAMLSDGLHKGASVKVTLPRATGSAAVSADLAVPSILSFHGVRVLVVDDHEDAAQAMSRLLARRGCEVRIAHDGPAGFSVAQQFKPDVLLLDLGLPRINGYDLARQLRMNAGTSDALFIAVSGYAQENDREIALKAGFDQHFPKPVDMHALSTAILNRMNERGKAGTSNVAV